ncbi:HD domain-containing phosphohydrolase [Chthonobacter rhizosphaerae]|uniref:HD domain-containing phosphohydrolase n=1 Tax=Chthonobacter rhizosphaerae TaxID=2735553 RepID=UPI0015EF1589|nr:HD domain-containing phosphohydrolase [Chthonobacter rhizosphaerae]
MKALLIDDNPTNLFMLSKLVQNAGLADVVSFKDPVAALAEAKVVQFDIVLCDYMMPGLDGLQVVKALRALPDYADVPIVMVTTVDQKQVCYDALEAGATDFLTKPVDMAEVKARVRNLASLRDMQNKMRDRAEWLSAEVRKATYEMSLLEEEIILRLSRASEYRDSDTGAHVVRMARTCREIAEELGMTNQFCRDIYLAAPMHDIGKIGVPDAILRKPGALTADERALMQTHTAVGASILAGSDSRLIRLAAEIAETHHERWNGSGYPRGLAGTMIPISGRIAAAADVFDALVSPRPYKDAWPVQKAVDYLVENAGTQFDPKVVAAFQARLHRILRILEEQPDAGGLAA